MSLAEAPIWSIDPQSYVEPFWGTTDPIHLEELRPHIFDSTGRLVTEFEEPNPANVPHDMREVSFSDSRDGKEADASALDALKEQYRLSFGILSHLRSKILGNRSETPSMEDFSQVLNAGIELPDWYVLKADNPIKNGELHPAIAGVAKICRGLFVPIQIIEEKMVQDRFAFTGYTRFNDSFMEGPKAFYDYVNKNKLLIGGKGTACPAPPAAIIYGAQILFGDNAPGTQDAEALLDLSDREIGRIKDFATAARVIHNESRAYKNIAVEVAPFVHQMHLSQGITSPLQLTNQTGRMLRKQESLSMKNMTQALRLANQALGRRPGRPVVPSDFPHGPSFIVKQPTFRVS